MSWHFEKKKRNLDLSDYSAAQKSKWKNAQTRWHNKRSEWNNKCRLLFFNKRICCARETGKIEIIDKWGEPNQFSTKHVCFLTQINLHFWCIQIKASIQIKEISHICLIYLSSFLPNKMSSSCIGTYLAILTFYLTFLQ